MRESVKESMEMIGIQRYRMRDLPISYIEMQGERTIYQVYRGIRGLCDRERSVYVKEKERETVFECDCLIEKLG